MCGFEIVGNGHHAKSFDVGSQTTGQRNQHRGIGPGETLDVVKVRLCTHQTIQDWRNHSPVGAIPAYAFYPLIARKPEPSRRIELPAHLLEKRVDLIGPSSA
jgi:hypothetical protein